MIRASMILWEDIDDRTVIEKYAEEVILENIYRQSSTHNI